MGFTSQSKRFWFLKNAVVVLDPDRGRYLLVSSNLEWACITKDHVSYESPVDVLAKNDNSLAMCANAARLINCDDYVGVNW